MLKKLATVAVLLGYTSAHACDVCGASGSSQGLGILPQFYKHFVGIQYQYRSFSSEHPGLFENLPKERSTEYYNTLQLWGKANIGSRIQVFGFLPYQYNNRVTDTGTGTYKGLGDASLLAMATIIRTADSSNRRIRHILLAGGGIKAPTGKRTSGANSGEMMNIQTGSGSWDFILSANYTLRGRNAGFNTDASYTLTTTNAANYKYGDRLSVSLNGFYWWKVKGFVLQPQMGIRADYALHDYDNYSRKWLNYNTGGYLTYITAGAQVYYKRLGLQCSYAIPVFQHYASGYVEATQKVETGLLYFF